MANRFQVQDLVSQTADTVVYRALTKEGTALALTRLRLDSEAVESLRSPGVFEQALAGLRAIKHDHLRVVLDAGQDEVDGYPWLTSQWLEGKPLSELEVGEKEMRNLGEQIQSLVADLGEEVNALNFDPQQILTARGENGRLHALFTIDYLRWFKDWAAGYPPGAGRSATAEFRKLLEGLAAKQLRLPKKEREQPPIPFVEERSPALTSYDPPRESRLYSILTWLGLLLALGVILFFTWQGMKRMKENPRDESREIERRI